MSAITTGAPNFISEGASDKSLQPQPPVKIEVPFHLPHFFIMAPKGKLHPQILPLGEAEKIYGAEAFSYRSKYSNHSTPFIKTIGNNANMIMFQRLKPADAPDPASLTISIDIVEDDIPVYQREADGSLSYDGMGSKIPTGETVRGHRIRMVTGKMDQGTILGSRNVGNGAMASSDDVPVQSKIYPIHDLRFNSFGTGGNNMGLSMWAPVKDDVNGDVIEDQKATIYRLQLKERQPSGSTVTVNTMFQTPTIDFGYKPGMMNPFVEQDLDFDNAYFNAYQSIDDPAVVPTYAPFDESYIYHDNLETVLDMIHALEAGQGILDIDEDAKWMINFISGRHYDGRHYHTLVVEGAEQGGVTFNRNTTHYASGGGDGTVDEDTFNELVRVQFQYWGELEYPFLDSAKYPMHFYYNTGFPIDVAKLMYRPMGLRKDIIVLQTTQDASQPKNNAIEDSAAGLALYTAGKAHPESLIHGTEAIRAMIVPRAGRLLNSQYKRTTPLLLALADKLSRWLGAGNGIWKPEYELDADGVNIINNFADLTGVWLPQSTRNIDWRNGLSYPQNFDHRQVFIPAFQTIHSRDDSTLNSAINMFAEVKAQIVAEEVFRTLVGKVMSPEVLIDTSNRRITERLNNFGGNRFIFEVQTYQDRDDVLRGYSYHAVIKIYSSTMNTVCTFRTENYHVRDLPA